MSDPGNGVDGPTAAGAPPGVDISRLTGHLEQALPGGLEGRLQITLLAGGRSNLTYAVTDGQRRWVLRRPPLGHVLATAHDMAREARVISALASTDVPVPSVVTTCNDATVLGAPFYLMERIDGLVLQSDDDLSRLPTEHARDVAFDLIDVLARLHQVDYQAVGLGDFGRPAGFLERQVRRWGQQARASHSRDIPALTELGDRLAAAVPTSQTAAVVHGDYRLDNVFIDPDRWRVKAVLDWEMATLGDPLADLGLAYVYWIGWHGFDHPTVSAPGAWAAFPGWPELAERYAATSRLDLDGLDWYIALAFYKLAVIFEGIHYRHVQGLTVGEDYDFVAPMPTALAERGLRALSGSA